MSPIRALLAAVFQVLLFGNALWGFILYPLSKFSAAIFDFAKFYTLIGHSKLDAFAGQGI